MANLSNNLTSISLHNFNYCPAMTIIQLKHSVFAGKSVLKVLQKYSIVVIFPTFTVSTIYADWSHTQRWKAAQIEQKRSAELLEWLKYLNMVFASLGITKQWGYMLVPLFGFYLGSILDRKETERMVMFRDKSALYGRTLKEGEEPSWPWLRRHSKV